MTQRPPFEGVHKLLEMFLETDFDGVVELRQQLVGVMVEPGCSCGCGTLDLIPLPSAPVSSAASPLPIGGVVMDESGNESGGLELVVRDGILSSLEIFSYGQPLPLPQVSQVQWQAVSR